jgi:hypothetical protein
MQKARNSGGTARSDRVSRIATSEGALDDSARRLRRTGVTSDRNVLRGVR